MASVSDDKLICLASVAGAHGIRGALKLRCYTEMPENVADYGPIRDRHARELFTLRVVGNWKYGVVVQASGIHDRDRAEALKGIDLFVHRSQLPPVDEDEYYFEDLIGLNAVQDDQPLGRVRHVDDYGASAVIEIETESGDILAIPFTQSHVLQVDLAAGKISVSMPTEALS